MSQMIEYSEEMQNSFLRSDDVKKSMDL